MFQSLLFLGILTGCAQDYSDGDEGHPVFEAPPTAEEREAFLRNFPVLNAEGDLAPPVLGDTPDAPVGVLLAFLGGTKGGFCTVSHIAPGRALTNAHCIAGPREPERYYVVFYDRERKRRHAAIKGFHYVGSTAADDVAVLDLDATTDEQWAVAGPDFLPSPAEVGHQPAIPHRMKMWSYDPFHRSSRLGNRYGGFGMRFHARECTVSRTRPRVIGNRENGASDNVSVPGDEGIHFFVDACDAQPINGNSGSLFSVPGDFAHKLGVYHWSVGPSADSIRLFKSFDYFGNEGPSIHLPNPPPSNEFFGVGTAVEAFSKYLLN